MKYITKTIEGTKACPEWLAEAMVKGEAYLKKDRTTWVRNERDWNWCFEDPVTHWMFLPEPPKRE